jgi:N-glycosidase YbiA
MAKVLEQETKFTYEGILNVNPEVCIDWFDEFGTNNPYSFLSNFYVGAPFEWRGKVWQTSEAAYAAAKVYGVDEELYNKISLMADPQDAKTAGRTASVIRHDWEEIKLDIMRQVTFAKFSQNQILIEALLATGSAYLQEGTFWDDRVWGVDLMTTNGDGSTSIETNPLFRSGKNWLGMVLMELRAKFKLILDQMPTEE